MQLEWQDLRPCCAQSAICHRTKDLDEPHAIAFLIFDSIGQVGFSFSNPTIFNYLNPPTLEIKTKHEIKLKARFYFQ